MLSCYGDLSPLLVSHPLTGKRKKRTKPWFPLNVIDHILHQCALCALVFVFSTWDLTGILPWFPGMIPWILSGCPEGKLGYRKKLIMYQFSLAFIAMSCTNLWGTKALQKLVPLMVGQISKSNHHLEIPVSLPLMGEDLKPGELIFSYLHVDKLLWNDFVPKERLHRCQ